MSNNEQDLAQIAFTLRFQNTTEEEDAQILFPWSHQNIPQPIRIESVQITEEPYKPHTLVIEHFADGSKFGRSEPI
jgi:hypothetical protein